MHASTAAAYVILQQDQFKYTFWFSKSEYPSRDTYKKAKRKGCNKYAYVN